MKKIITNKLEIYDSDDTTLRKVFYNTGFSNIEYDDLLPNDGWTNAPGGAAPDVVNHTIAGVGFQFMSFDGGNTEERISNSFEILHGVDIESLNAGTQKLEIHTHGMASTTASGVVKIFFDLVYFPIDLAPLLMGSYSVLIPILANQQYFHKVSGVEITKPTSNYNIGDKIKVRYRRTPTDAEDIYGGDWLFEQCAIHAPLNSNGSRQRYSKL